MIVRIEAFFRKFLRLFSRSEWMVRLLNLSHNKIPETEQGLVMIQIDGLGLTQFERALKNGKMPFLSGLTHKEGYRIHRHYSGLPSNTPAVQGALFYGVQTCVPAFSFKDRKTGNIMNMFSAESAIAVEKDLKEKGEALLEGGSAYGNIFTGGSKEAHFCVSSIGWGTVLKAANPLGLPLTIVLNLPIFIRALFLMGVELIWALVDLVQHVISGKNFLGEVLYIPLRVAVCVLLRDLIAMGAKIDIARGLPVIHMNFAGYDEQAHHRGPTSGHAHWSLKGIDSAIAGVWSAAHSSRQRNYTVYIYSDHGQEETSFYGEEYGRSVQEAVTAVFKESALSDQWKMQFSYGSPHWRAQLLRNKPSKQIKHLLAPENEEEKDGEIAVAALGAVGHIYSPRPLSPEEMEGLALKLIETAKIPTVMVPTEAGKVTVWNQAGKFIFPDEAEKLIDPQHPFFDEIKRDLTALCYHPNAGTFVILGVRGGRKTLTFHAEQGSHAGPGAQETSGFALLPRGALPRSSNGSICTMDLRQAAFRAMERNPPTSPGSRSLIQDSLTTDGCAVLRVMTYNVHGCMGRDGKISPGRIAAIIARHDPDIIALQELDTSEETHQAQVIAQKLAAAFHYHPCLTMKKGQRGNAILSKFPMRLVRNGPLPRFSRTPFLEPRGALWVEIDAYGEKIQVFNTHLSLSSHERVLQMEALSGPNWLGDHGCRGRVLFCGDFNASAKAPIFKKMTQELKNTHFELAGHRPLKTLPSFYPLGLVDHIFAGPGFTTTGIEVPKTALERISSDHLPLIVDFQIIE